jgi:hypothetical protein
MGPIFPYSKPSSENTDFTTQYLFFCILSFLDIPCLNIVLKKLYSGGAEAGERADAAEEQEQGAPGRAGEPPQCP